MELPAVEAAARMGVKVQPIAVSHETKVPVLATNQVDISITALAAAAGVWAVRVHDVGGSRDAVHVAEAWKTGAQHG